MDYSPFLRPDSVAISDVFTDGAVHVIGRVGIDRFSARAIARWMGVSPAAVLNDYSRLRLLELIVICFEERWLEWSGSDSFHGPNPATIPLRLPETPDERLGVQVMGALHQLAESERLRGNTGPSGSLTRLARKEREFLRFRLEQLRRCCGAAPTDVAVASTIALVAGLRADLASPTPANGHDSAVALVEEHVTALVPHRDQCITARARRSA